MNDASETPKIVNLGLRPEPRRQEVGGLLDSVRAIAGRHLGVLLGRLFDNLDDALFDLAEKAENNAAQTQFFDGMRELRKRRPAIERAFLDRVTQQLLDVSGNRPAGGAAAATPPASGFELSLVADHELEESLAITSMAGKNETRLARDLFALNQRLSVICGGASLDDATSPFGPAALAQAFRHAVRELGVDMRVKLIVYKLFDRYVLAALEEMYREIGDTLVRAGVLPQLRHEIRRGGAPAGAAPGLTAGHAASASPGQPPLPAQAGEAATAEDAAASSELLQNLLALLDARRGAPAGGWTAAPAAPLPTAGELVNALSLLQSQSAAYAVPAGGAPVAPAQEDIQQLKAQLLGQLGALRGERAGQVARVDEDTIDLVGMLFEFILEDRNLPADMQALLARLQIPYLKAALLDRKLFAHRQHPARRLLDDLAEAAKSWSAEADRDHRLYDTIKSIVERLLRDFDDDTAIFGRLSAELQDFLEQNQRRAVLAEQRVAEAAQGREKLEQARQRAAREIQQRIGRQQLPPLVHGVLVRPWANYLVLLLLRQGEESLDFREALRFVDLFVDSTRPMRDLAGRQALRQVLPAIERGLRRGLASVAYQEHDTERLLGQLHTYYRHQLGQNVSEPELRAALDADALPDGPQPIVEPVPAPAETAASMEEEPAVDGAALQLADSLRAGDWLEFTGADGAAERAKLSWISPISGRLLFVNRRGLKVADYSVPELAARFAAGNAFVLEGAALVDRALVAIVERLSQGDSKDA